MRTPQNRTLWQMRSFQPLNLGHLTNQDTFCPKGVQIREVPECIHVDMAFDQNSGLLTNDLASGIHHTVLSLLLSY